MQQLADSGREGHNVAEPRYPRTGEEESTRKEMEGEAL